MTADTLTSDVAQPTPSGNGDPSAPQQKRLPITVVILTLNEESNIAQCIASCDWCDDIHVVDSGYMAFKAPVDLADVFAREEQGR